MRFTSGVKKISANPDDDEGEPEYKFEWQGGFLLPQPFILEKKNRCDKDKEEDLTSFDYVRNIHKVNYHKKVINCFLLIAGWDGCV